MFVQLFGLSILRLMDDIHKTHSRVGYFIAVLLLTAAFLKSVYILRCSTYLIELIDIGDIVYNCKNHPKDGKQRQYGAIHFTATKYEICNNNKLLLYRY